MADLTGQTPANTYKGLLQVNDYTNGVDATAKYIQDGEGTNSALSISTGNVGIGTANPSAKLDLNNGASPVDLQFTETSTSFHKLGIRKDGEAIQFCEYNNDGDTLQSSFLVVEATPGGANIGFNTTSFGTSAASVLGINNGTAPTSSPADMVQLYAEDVATSSELRVRDEAGNVTTLSPHAKDAPDSLYDQGKGVDEMHRVANHYLGTIVFTNVDRRNDLLQKQLNGEELPEDRTFTITETFAEYNARTGAELEVEDWDANQQAMADADESYVKKPKPEWLS
jgi:hypothetical protein